MTGRIFSNKLLVSIKNEDDYQELISWEVWTNELIKWSEQGYRNSMPERTKIEKDRVQTTWDLKKHKTKPGFSFFLIL
jgi:hypothetical protein